MADTKFTPGPWVAGRNGRYVYQEADASPICTVAADVVVNRRAEDSANARLIAAAPDMYAALMLVSIDNTAESLESIGDVMAALAKARGE